MSAAIIISIISVVVVCFSVAVAYIQYRDNHRTNENHDLHELIREIAQEVATQSNEPLKTLIADHTTRLTQTGDRLNRVEDLMKGNSTDLRSAIDTMNKMGVKVDMYWTTLETLAINAAKGLHQPDPRRARIDHLLEAFMEGTLTAEERIDLKKLLVLIRNYDPGTSHLNFPVYPGEQTAAAILLSTMDVVDPARMATYGHAAHRSHKPVTDFGEHDE